MEKMVGEGDRFLPIANIGRIMKEALPNDKQNGQDPKIAKDARETVQECVSDFISFITAEACEKCVSDKRRTINGHDLIFALRQLGFERYCENLEKYFVKYEQCDKFIKKGGDNGKKANDNEHS